jgi:hypothetical protein
VSYKSKYTFISYDLLRNPALFGSRPGLTP